MLDPQQVFSLHDLLDHFMKAAEKQVIQNNPDTDYDDRSEVYAEAEWAELIMRYAAEFVTDLVEQIGGLFTPEGPGVAARQAWFGEDFNYSVPDRDHPGHWNAAFLYNASEGMAGIIREVAYEFARRGHLMPHEVGKNFSDFTEGGRLA